MARIFKATRKKAPEQAISVTVERLDQHGRGIASYGKKAIFIDGLLANEQATVTIVEQNSKFARARVNTRKVDSEYRVKPECRHFYTCGGCDLQHLAYQQQLSFKQQKLEQLFSRQHIPIDLPWQQALTGSAYHYRRKARIGVQYNKNNQPIIGFRQSETNTLASIKHCPILVDDFQEIFSDLTRVLTQLKAKKSVGHIEVLAVNKNVLVIRQLMALTKYDQQQWLAFEQQHNLVIYIDDGKQVVPLSKAVELYYQLANNIKITLEVKDFIRVNHGINKEMVQQALTWLQLNSDDIVLDLFCGLGNFSLPIAQQVKQVVGVEGVSAMVNKAQANATLNNIENCQFYQADLNASWSKQLWAQQAYSKAVLDPARAGANEALKQMITLNIDTILYISCDPQSLALDTKLLVAQGYKIEKIALVDMFAQTKHSETMVLFRRSVNKQSSNKV